MSRTNDSVMTICCNCGEDWGAALCLCWEPDGPLGNDEAHAVAVEVCSCNDPRCGDCYPKNIFILGDTEDEVYDRDRQLIVLQREIAAQYLPDHMG